ncbi:UPF0225 protein YchJ [hydrothermal vent metagenome]|uniref:UPF0225 protein YchJ n=1 Tax=hydrothermal vent metagenome TaxID=652676 RepID=A0A3B0Y289_9ZZZZ
MENSCPCGSAKEYASCCGHYIIDHVAAPTAELLMRSRYTAYYLANEEYLLDTWHPSTRPKSLNFNKGDAQAKWLKLTVNDIEKGTKNDSEGTVEFTARFKIKGKADQLHEISQFSKVGVSWYYVGGVVS